MHIQLTISNVATTSLLTLTRMWSISSLHWVMDRISWHSCKVYGHFL